MTTISSAVGQRTRAIRLGASSVGLVALGALALSCSAPGSSDAPEETIDSVEEAIGGPLCAPAVAPTGAGFFDLVNNVTGQNDRYADTLNLTFLLNVQPEMPFIAPHESPFGDTVALVTKGFAGGHSAIDYRRTTSAADASFNVRAVAPGTVVTVTYDNAIQNVGTGNTVVIEHTAPSGKKYRSFYAHLRNGATNDCLAARTFIDNPSPPVPVIQAYRNYINSQNCSGTLSIRAWGNVADRILVAPGDQVTEGQMIARAGNTGMGGVVQGLNSNGTFTDAVYNNVHLHLFFSVADTENVSPPGSNAQWIMVDPYGAYATTANNCYVYGANVAGHRLFAPFNPTFAGVAYDAYRWYFDYYPSMGYAPQTVSLYPSGSQQLVAGSFQPGHSPQWFSAINQTKAEFLAVLNQHSSSGYQLREVQVSSLQGGAIRYNGIWARRTGTNPSTVLDDSDQSWQTRLQGEANNGRHPTDEFTYTEGGVRKHAGIFVGDGVPAGSWNPTWGRTLSSFNTFLAQEATFGRKPTSVSAEPPGNTLFGGMFTAAQGDWVLETEIAGASNFLRRERTHAIAGRRLYRVQGYGDGQKFAAIWVGGERPPSAIMTSSGATTCGNASTITLDARTSIFDAAFPLEYEWSGPFGFPTGAVQTVNLPVGSHQISLFAWDGRGLQSLTSGQIDITQDVTAPTLTVPAAITISTCTNANIGTATAADACGTPTITNDKPSTFPLGNTTVTWTARDQAGNTTTRTQVVTAVLGDNTTCCPAGTTIRMGTSAGEPLSGTSVNDCIIGLGGDDIINGGGGNDAISGGSGSDTIDGSTGTDRCYGGLGIDMLSNCETSVL